MIEILNAQQINGKKCNFSLESPYPLTLQAEGLTILPGLIDPHVHFRTPGLEHKENWRTGALAAIHGGYTTVFDMPNTLPPTICLEYLKEKKQLIEKQLTAIDIPLRYQLFFGADKNHFAQIPLITAHCIGIKVFMGCSTGNLVIDDDDSLQTVFKIAAQEGLIVAVHAEDEALLQQQKIKFQGSLDYAAHSEIRNTEVARRAVAKAIELTQQFGTRLYLLHISTQAELSLIKQAKIAGLPVYAETTPHHLFLNHSAYSTLSGKAVVNPPLRGSDEQEALLQAIHEGTIDTIGSDHAPHLLYEKAKPYGECPSGMPGIETTLPLLLNAYHEKKLSLEEIVSLTSTRPREIFNLPEVSDVTLVDLEKTKSVSAHSLKTQCGWSPFEGYSLKGWPVYTVVQGRIFKV